MKEIESNKHAWGQISEGHYHHFKKALHEGTHQFNRNIQNELGDLSGKKIIHLQCNTGPDTILLAKMCASAVGVDLVPDNILYAKKLDEAKLANNVMEIKYPYFGKEPDVDDSIGGYATTWADGVKAYFWLHTVSDIINALTFAGLHIEYFNEFQEEMCDMGGMKCVGGGLWNYDFNDGKFPMGFSLKATVYLKY